MTLKTEEVKMEKLKQFPLVYVGTPYSQYPKGIVTAFEDAAALTGKLLVAGIKAYSPIAHAHPIAIHANLDPYDHGIWLPFDQAMMDAAAAMVVAMMEGWDTSFGVQHEIDFFLAAGKPVFYLNPTTMEVEDIA